MRTEKKMSTITPVKTTFGLLESSNKRLTSIQDEIETEYDITRTDLINIAVSEFLTHIETPDDILQYLRKYSKI